MGLSKKENGLIIEYYHFLVSPIRWFLKFFNQDKGAVRYIYERQNGRKHLLQHSYTVDGEFKYAEDYENGKYIGLFKDGPFKRKTTLKQKIKLYYEGKEKLIQLHKTQGRYANKPKFTQAQAQMMINKRPRKTLEG